MGYEVRIDAFEGPLDLLLHLLKEAKVSIYDIKISEITHQYLDYIHAMEELKLEIASEYEEDTREALIQRLVEYQQYKEVTKELRELEEERGQFFTKPPIDFSDYIDHVEKLPQNLQVEQLISAFEKLLRRHKLTKPLKTRIVPQNISVEERMKSLSQQLKYKKRVAFASLFERFDKEYIVVTFLALLELVKSNQISISQQSYYEDIYISSLEGDEVV